MAKIKRSKNGYFKITGISLTHLEAIGTLINYTRLGDGVYENAAYELAVAFQEFNNDFFNLDDCILTVDLEDKSPTINLVSKYD